MFIYWGTKRTEKKQGLVADFCPVCRDLRAFRLSRIGSASHVYGISFGQGKLVDHVIQCLDCGVRLSTDPFRYASVVPEIKRAPVDPGELEKITFPGAREFHALRLALEARVRHNAHILAPEQRENLLLEPFQLLNPGVGNRCLKRA